MLLLTVKGLVVKCEDARIETFEHDHIVDLVGELLFWLWGVRGWLLRLQEVH